MKRMSWTGWLLAILLLLQNAAVGLSALTSTDPLEGHLLQYSGTFYLYHNGLRFAVQLDEIGDQVVGAIPTATSSQWDALFAGDTVFKAAPSGAGAGPAGHLEPVPPGQPEPFPGYS
jgi:threonine/homoserine/homoserine lactone efflux protein